MNIFAKIRAGFTLFLGEALHQEGVIVALTEAEFAAAEHKLEVLAEDVAQALHMTKGHALAISPALTVAALNTPLQQTVNAGGGAPDPVQAQAAAGAMPAAAEPTQEPAPEPQVQAGPTVEPAA